MTLYIDLYFLLNLACDFLILCVTGKSLKLSAKLKRVIAASVTGSFFSCIDILYGGSFFHFFTLFLIPPLMLFISFGKRSPLKYFEGILIFWGCSFLLGGILTVISDRISGTLPLPLFFGITFFVMFFCFLFFDIFSSAKDISSVNLKILDCGKNAEITLLVDSGCLLKEPIGGLPVILISKKIFQRLFPSCTSFDIESAVRLKRRLVPMKTASGEGMIYAVMPESIYISGKFGKKDLSGCAMIGCAGDDSFCGFDGIFPRSLL